MYIKLKKFNSKYNVIISIDDSGIIEYWSSSTFEFPKNLKFQFKIDTDLFDLIKVIIYKLKSYFIIDYSCKKIYVFNLNL